MWSWQDFRSTGGSPVERDIWRRAVSGALSADEVDTKVDPRKEEKICPWKMSIHDLAIVAFCAQIFAWFKNVSRKKHD